MDLNDTAEFFLLKNFAMISPSLLPFPPLFRCTKYSTENNTQLGGWNLSKRIHPHFSHKPAAHSFNDIKDLYEKQNIRHFRYVS